jgi:hypothetical protein
MLQKAIKRLILVAAPLVGPTCVGSPSASAGDLSRTNPPDTTFCLSTTISAGS